MPDAKTSFPNLPEDNAIAESHVVFSAKERDREKQRADELHVQNLRLQRGTGALQEVVLRAAGGSAEFQRASWRRVLLDFGEELEQKPIHPEDVPRGQNPSTNCGG